MAATTITTTDTTVDVDDWADLATAINTATARLAAGVIDGDEMYFAIFPYAARVYNLDSLSGCALLEQQVDDRLLAMLAEISANDGE